MFWNVCLINKYRFCNTITTVVVIDTSKEPAIADKGDSHIIFHIFIFHLFREGCPSTEVVFQGALQLKTNYNIQ